MIAPDKLAQLTACWERSVFDSAPTLEDYLKRVAERFEIMYGEQIAATVDSVYDALKLKGLI